MTSKKFSIANHEIQPGEFKEISINIARLPSRTKIETPIYVYRAPEDGPTLALTAGMHGDEINGMEIVRRIIDRGYNRVKRGTTLCMPVINVYGFLNYSREVPDGKDINRSFPGSKGGSLAARVAYHITHDVIPNIDYGVDFHTGGAMRTNFPQVRCMMKDEVNMELARAFSAPFTIDSPFRPHSLRLTASKKNKHIIVFEGGESLRFDKYAIEEGISGTLRLMKHLNMIDTAPAPEHENKIIWSSAWARAHTAGLFQPSVECGMLIEKDQLVGTLTDPFGEFKEEVKAPSSGYVVGLNNNPVVNAGDALLHIGVDNFCKIGAAGEE
ncbi:MAG: putative deacylase [Cytophagales bacterium]|jgi:predicted deacylase|nr:succinylglutamate desuccinylase/aspartoacylase family protein [Bacteroidota bacterium]MBS1980979.1 succinylglutamate desuccinylase/aspartoacylase family protein [Bacteroidota bacterium]WHZ08338.1 MAG: putative deacylase [Cytophagales bacterium]